MAGRLVMLVVLLAVAAPALGQQDDPLSYETRAASRPDQVESAGKLMDPSVPLGAVRSYLQACRRGDWDIASGFLSLTAMSPDDRDGVGARLAWQLKVVLDRTLPIPYERLSREPEGHTDDGLPANFERLGQVGGIEILLEKDSGKNRWIFAADTVAAVPELYQRFGYGVLGEFLPAPMFEISVMDLQLWQWAGLLLAALMAYVVAWCVSWLTHRVARRVALQSESKIDDRLVDKLVLPFRLLVALGIFISGAAGLALPIGAFSLIGNLAIGVAVLLVEASKPFSLPSLWLRSCKTLDSTLPA